MYVLVLADYRAGGHHDDLRGCYGPEERGDCAAGEHEARVPGNAKQPSAQSMRHCQDCRNRAQEAKHSLRRR